MSALDKITEKLEDAKAEHAQAVQILDAKPTKGNAAAAAFLHGRVAGLEAAGVIVYQEERP